MSPSLPAKSSYSVKDQEKSDKATCFIGRGSPKSSTHGYMLAWGDKANKAFYYPADIAFVSSEGDRLGRLDPDFVELTLACRAGVTFITDIPAHRARAYNMGERQVAQFLLSQGYHEHSPGLWVLPALHLNPEFKAYAGGLGKNMHVPGETCDPDGCACGEGLFHIADRVLGHRASYIEVRDAFELVKINEPTIRTWMETFDKWAQDKDLLTIVHELTKKGFKPYILMDQPPISREPGINLVDMGCHLHIPYVLDHKVIWGPNGMVAITSSGEILHATHTI